MPPLLKITAPATLEHLEGLVKSLSGCAKSQGFDPDKVYNIELAAEEVLVNIFRYAYPEEPGEVEVNCRMEGVDFILEITDSGIAFDMTQAPPPDREADIAERNIGGLGIFLVKTLMDDVRYRREDGRNILTLIVRKAGQ